MDEVHLQIFNEVESRLLYHFNSETANGAGASTRTEYADFIQYRQLLQLVYTQNN